MPDAALRAMERKRVSEKSFFSIPPGEVLKVYLDKVQERSPHHATHEFSMERALSHGTEAINPFAFYDVNLYDHAFLRQTSSCEQCVCSEGNERDVEDAGPPDYDDFTYQELFEHATKVDIPWTRLPELEEGVRLQDVVGPAGGRRALLMVEPFVLRQLAERAIGDVEHFLRPGHLEQLAKITEDPDASDNDRFIAHNLLENAVIAAEGTLPGCQDTGTAIVLGKRGQFVWTDEDDEKHLSHGIYDAYTRRNLRYSQVSPVNMFAEKNTKCNLPAQIDIYATKGSEYNFMFMAKGGGSANKTYLYQQTKALLTPKALEAFIKEKVVTLGTSACPPYHLALVIGGLSAEGCLKTVKLASAKYLDDLPQTGNEHGRAYRDVQWEQKVLRWCYELGIGAQYGGKYFVHDVRVIRMPRHGASCPVGLGVSCSADRQILAKISPDGVFIEELEKNPSRFVKYSLGTSPGGCDVVKVDLQRPMKEILAQLTQYPVKTRLSLTGTIIVARDIAHAKLAEQLETEGVLPCYMGSHVVYYAGPAKQPEGYASGSFGPTTAGRMDTYVPMFQKHGYSMITLAKGNRSAAVTQSCHMYGGFYLGSIGGAAAILAKNCIKAVKLVEYEELGMEAVWCIDVEDFPAFIIVDDKGNDFFSSWRM